MEKIKNNIVLIDTYNREEKDYYEMFKDFFYDVTNDEDTDIVKYTIEGEGDEMVAIGNDGSKYNFMDWYYKQCEIEDEDFWYGFRSAQKDRTLDCVVTGSLGLWDGKHKIYPTCGELMEMINKCLKDAYDYVLKIENNVLYVENHHHDGTNYYEIRLVNGENYDKIVYWDDDEDGDFAEFMKNPANFEDFYYEYFYTIY